MQRCVSTIFGTLLLASCAGAAQGGDGAARSARACTPCHGEQGRAAADGYQPRIAGKPAGYLLEQLHAFREGRRRYALMAELLEPLSDDSLRRIAEHFSALDLPYPPPSAHGLTPAAAQATERLVRQGDTTRQLPACTACHGERLTGALPAVPSLLGLPRDYLVAQLGAWREGTRRSRAPDCMAHVARRLREDEVARLAAWLAAQPVPRPAAAAAALPAPLPLRCAVPQAAGR